MNYKLIETPEGNRWLKQTWNEETESIDKELLAVGEPLMLSPDNFVGDSSVFLFKDRPREVMQHENGDPYTLNDLIAELEETPRQEFKPFVFYNKAGDGLQIYLEDKGYVCQWVNNGLDLMYDIEDRTKIIGLNIWGLKKLLLQAYANCDEPSQVIELKALNPHFSEDKNATNSSISTND